MKKHTRLLSLLLAISLLMTSVFVTNVFASDGAGQTDTNTEESVVVGSYTQPAGSWTPDADHEGIVYGVWASEADFLAGKAPDYHYTDGEFTGARIGTTDNNGQNYGVAGYTPGYVHCFGDVTNSTAQIPTGKQQTLVINLAGHTLANAKGFRIGGQSGVKTEASLTIENGVMTHTGGQMQTRGNSSLIYDNVVYNHTGGAILYDDGCDLLEFRSSSLISTKADVCLDISPSSYGGDSEIRFVNTDVVFEKEQTLPLFRFNGPAGPGVQTKSASVYFDGSSSLKRSGANLVALNCAWYDYANKDDDGDGVFGSYSAIQYVNFEVGFKYSENGIPTTFDQHYYNRSAGKYSTVKETETLTASAKNWLVIGVKSFGTNVKDYLITETDDGFYQITEIPTEDNSWKPTADYAGITYGVWASEAEYLAGNAPAKWYTGELTKENIGATDNNGSAYADPGFIPGFVRLYADVKSSAQIPTGNKQKLVIDLGGNTLSGAAFRIGGSGSNPEASLTVKNGNWNYSVGQFHVREDTTLIMKNVNWTISHGNADNSFFYTFNGDYLRFTNCTIKATAGYYFKFNPNYSNKGFARSEIIFENTQLSYDAAPEIGIFYLAESQYGDCQYDISFDADSSISGAGEVFMSLKETADYTFTQKQTVTFAEGFTYNGSATELPTQYTFIDAGGATDVRTANDELVQMSSAPEAEPDPDDPIEPDPDDPVEPDPDDPNAPEYPIVAYGPDGNVVKQWKKAHIEDGVLSDIPSGSKIVLYANATAGSIHTYSDFSLTFDLNGHKLTFTTSENMQLGHSMSGSWKERVITFTSSEGRGTLDATKRNGNCFQARPGTIAVLENLDITFGGNGFNDGGSKSITFTNCKVQGSAGRNIGNTDGLGKHEEGVERIYTFNNTEIIGMNIHNNLLAVSDVLTFNFGAGTVIDNSKALITISPSQRAESAGVSGVRIVTVNIEAGVKYLNPTANGLDIINDTCDNTVINSGFFSDNGEVGLGEAIAPDKIVFAEVKDGGVLVGEIGKLDTAGYGYTVITPGAIGTMKLPSLNAEGKPVLTCADIMSFAEGATVVFHTDLIYDPDGSTAGQGRLHGYKAGIIYDLNGYTFYFAGYRFQLEKSFTFKNGTVNCNGTTTVPFMGNPGESVMMNFYDVDLVITEPGEGVFTVFNPYSGNIVFNGGSINAATSCNVFSFTNTTRHTLALIGTEITAGTLISASYVAGLNDEYTVTDCDVTLTGELLTVAGNYAGTDDSIKLSISGSKLNVADLLKADGVTSPLAVIEISETYFKAEPAVDVAKGTLSLAKGEKITALSEGDYLYRVTALRINLKANILLESVFSIQFMVPEDTNIVSIKIGDTLYTVEAIENTVEYNGATYKLIAVKGINPGEAADDVMLEVVYTDGGVVHTATAGYSVLNYVTTLLNTDYSRYIKRMAVAAVEYIAETYEYLGKASDKLAALQASSNYLANLPEAVTAVGGDTDFGTAGTALSTARLDLGATMKFRFALNSGYTGTLTVGGITYDVENGKVGELDYVSVELAAHELYDTVIVISGDGISGTYSLAEYASYIASSDASDADRALVAAFFTYCAYADAYADIVIH